MRKGEIIFNGISLYNEFGIIAERMQDPLYPPSRESSIVIPGRSGSYHFREAESFHDEVQVVYECRASEMQDRAKAREIAYALTTDTQARLTDWQEPEMYRLGKIYDSALLEYEICSYRRFSLQFTCYPYTFGQTIVEEFQGSRLVPNYQGTRKALGRLEIKNTGSTPISGIKLIITSGG